MKRLEKIRSKIVTINAYLNISAQNKGVVVFTNGCFDILHKGHIELLAGASDLGDKLIVGLNTDLSVKRLKGENRPLQDDTSRATILASLEFVDYVILFEEDTPINLIESIRPDILVKGGDYKPEDIVGYDSVTKNGGKVVCLDLVEGYSSSSIIEKMK